MRIGIIGFGYWGKIIFNNLKNLNKNHTIILCDNDIEKIKNQNLGNRYEYYSDYKDVKCDKVFVVSNTDKHYEIVKYFLQNKVDTFCEKPLTITYDESVELYDIAKTNKCNLFVDWVFTFNNEINTLKNIIKKNNLKIKNIIFNRLNYGPERFEVDSVYDLSSHDVSILYYLFEKEPKDVKWIRFKRDSNSIQNDSNVGILIYDDFTVQINSSWLYGEKFRKSYFEFDKGFIYWDDMTQELEIKINDLIVNKCDMGSPLLNSINSFLNNNFDVELQKDITLSTQKIIEFEK